MKQDPSYVPVPFPPYTDAACAQRFPDDPVLQQRIRVLRAMLVEHAPRAVVGRTYQLSQARLSQFLGQWKSDGLASLSVATRRSANPLAAALVRRLLPALHSTTEFAIGSNSIIRAWLPQIRDTALRGHWAATQLHQALQTADALLEARYGAKHLLAEHFLHGQAIKALAQLLAFSQSRLYTLVDVGIAAMVERLNGADSDTTPPAAWAAHLRNGPLLGRERDLAALNQLLLPGQPVRLVGLPGVGKSTLAAALATAWARAGWNILWIRSSPTTAHAEQLAAELHGQLARYGAVHTPKPDASRPLAEQLATIINGLQGLPVCLIIDDIQTGLTNNGWADLLQRLCAKASTTRILLIGRSCSLEVGVRWSLEGLNAEAAFALYNAARPMNDGIAWQTVYRATGGNPQLVQLAASSTDTHATMTGAVQHLLGNVLASIAPATLDLLAWLCWYEGPVSRNHAFVQAAIGNDSAWQTLIQRQLITCQHEQLVVHDLVRDHIRYLLPPAQWERIRLAVQTYAHHAEDWHLGYRCAVAVNDSSGQIAMSRQLARDAERRGEPLMAVHWWGCLRQHAEGQQCTQSIAEARLGEAENLLQLTRPTAALSVLEPLLHATEAEIVWWVALLQVEAYRLLGDGPAMTRLIESAPLQGPPPLAVGAVGHWRLAFEHVLVLSRLGNLNRAWRQYTTLGAPPPGTPLALFATYTATGAMLALEHAAYYEYERLSRAYRRQAKYQGQAYSRCAMQIEWGRGLYQQEQFLPARRLFDHTLRQLDPQWLTLRWFATLFLALAEHDLGRPNTALQAWNAATQIVNELNAPGYAGFTLLSGGVITLIAGMPARASQLFDEALAHYQHANNQSQCAVVTYWQAQLALHQGDAELALERLHMILPLIRTYKLRRLLLNAELTWSECQCRLGNLVKAETHARRVHRANELLQLPVSRAEAIVTEAEALLQARLYTSAVPLSTHATTLIESYPRGLRAAPRIWWAHACVLEQLQSYEQAHRAWQVARTHLDAQIKQLPTTSQFANLRLLPYHHDILDRTGGLRAHTPPSSQQRGRKPTSGSRVMPGDRHPERTSRSPERSEGEGSWKPQA